MAKQIRLEELKNLHFYVDRIECHRQIFKDGSEWTGNIYTPRRYYGLVFICSEIDAVYFRDNKEMFTARQGDVVYLPKGCRYRSEFKKGGRSTDTYTLNFTLFDKSGDELILPDEPTLFCGAASPTCRAVASRLADAFLFSQGELKKQALFSELLDSFLTFFETRSKHFATIKIGVDMLCAEWNKNEKIQKYADACGISESSFYSLFKTWAGVSPIDYRNGIRLTAAKSMLVNSSLRISEIAFNVGFDDPYYFTRFFKKKTGISPRKFRSI